MGSQTTEQGADVAALRVEVERLRAEHRRFRESVDRELVRKEFKIGELERTLHRTSLEYQSSLSWRITKPLRAAKAMLRELRRG